MSAINCYLSKFYCFAYESVFTVTFRTADISVQRNGIYVLSIHNKDKHWKPCITHAKALIQLAHKKKVTGVHSQKRVRKTKPVLKVVQ